MKLWKMNAILLMLSLALCSCTESKESLSLEKKGPLSMSDPYAENDKYLNKVEESELDQAPLEQTHEMGTNFLETSGPIKRNIYKSYNKYSSKPTRFSRALNLVRPASRRTGGPYKRKPSGLRVVRVANPRLGKEDSKFESFTNCGKKTGFLNIIKKLDHSDGELHISPVYIDMSVNSIKFYSSPTNTKTLFNIVKLDKILRISQQKKLEGHSCFELILADYAENSRGLSKENVSLCANSVEKMKSWIDAIGAFKECQINVNNVDHNRKILVDFQKVNELTKVAALTSGKGLKPGAGVGNPENSLYYDNIPTINKSATKIQKNNSIKHEIDKILDFVKQSNIQQTQVQRKMQNELKEAQKFSEEVHEKQEIIRKILERRAEKEKMRQQLMLQSEEKFKELKLLKAVENRIVKMKKKEIEEYSEQFNKQIKEERSKANSESKKMMKALIQEEKKKPYNDCTDTRLLLFEDKSYVKERCTVYYGEHVNFFYFSRKEKNVNSKKTFVICVVHIMSEENTTMKLLTVKRNAMA